MEIRRLSRLEQAPSVSQAGLPGDPAPDLVWPINPGSAVGKGLRKAIVSAALGKRGSAQRLSAYLRDYQQVTSGGKTEGSAPEVFEKMVVGWYTETPGRNAISGYVFWFDKIPARDTSEITGISREI